MTARIAIANPPRGLLGATEPYPGIPGSHRDWHGWRRAEGPRSREALGYTELAVIALSRALQVTLEIPRRFPDLGVRVPAIVKCRAKAVLALRANCEHLENDELQRPLADKDNQLIAVFRANQLFAERRVAGETCSLDIDAEATGLLTHARQYLVDAITRLTRRPPTPPVARPATKRRRR